MKDKNFLALASLFFVLFFIGIGIVTLEKPLSGILRAKNVSPSPLKSFAVPFPQVAKTGAKIKVNVYVRDVSGAVLANRSIKLTSTANISIAPSDTQITNDLGVAEFSITGNAPGQVQLILIEQESKINITNVPTVEFTE